MTATIPSDWWTEREIPGEWLDEAQRIVFGDSKMAAARWLRERLASGDVEYVGVEYDGPFRLGRVNRPSLVSCAALLWALPDSPPPVALACQAEAIGQPCSYPRCSCVTVQEPDKQTAGVSR